MKNTAGILEKINTKSTLLNKVAAWKMKGQQIVFTNGVFDLLHHGHLASLEEAAGHGDKLIVAINTDESVRRLKGPSRPIVKENERLMMLASLLVTDAVILFEEDTPYELICSIMPDVLVKGGDYQPEQVAGAKEVIDHGGKLVLAKMVDGISTTSLIEKLKS